jgi:hypothetical protein
MNTLETLLTDSAEWFFYGFLRGEARRYFGGRFRIDDGSSANYTGPFYDIHQVTTAVPVQPGSPLRAKRYYFDSVSKLLSKTVYTAATVTSETSVETDLSGWTTKGGQSFPGTITRKENGAVVFTFTVASAVFGPAVSDGTFPTN